MDKARGRKRHRLLPACNRQGASEVVQVAHRLEVVPAAQHLRIGVDDCMVVCDGDQERSC